MSGGAFVCDTETTGFDDPDPIEVAVTAVVPFPRIAFDAQSIAVKRYRPRKFITLGALATHHIIKEDLVDCELWVGKWIPPEDSIYMIGHNVDFDWKVLGRPNIKTICTLALARKVWPKIDSHTLGSLIYNLYPHQMARELLTTAHSAGTDVDLCCRVLFSMLDALGSPDTWEDVWHISEDARVPKVWDFGKYGPKDGKPGRPLTETKLFDPGYHAWVLREVDKVQDDPYWQKALLR